MPSSTKTPVSVLWVTPPGLSETSATEWNYWFDHLGLPVELKETLRVSHSGLEWSAPWAQIVQLDRYLKIPSHLYLTVAEFTVESFSELRDKCPKWQPGWGDAEAYQLQVTARKTSWSPPQVKKNLLKLWGIPKRESVEDETSSLSRRCLVRVEKNRFQIKLSAQSQWRYKRGYRTHIGEAPLRENIAAGLLWSSLKQSPFSHAPQVLLDPMAGSGTFLFEALHLFAPRTSNLLNPAMGDEEAALEKISRDPISRDPISRVQASRGWASRDQALDNESFHKERSFGNAPSAGSPWPRKFLLSDASAKMRHAFEFNQAAFFEFNPVPSGWELSDRYGVALKDLQDHWPSDWPSMGVWLVSNPPYGMRIKGRHWMDELAQFLKSPAGQTVSRVSLLLPTNMKRDLEKRVGLRFKPTLSLETGGVKATWFEWNSDTVPSSS